MRQQNLRGADRNRVPRGNWTVTTPCIEPVPERLTFEAFVADLAEHGIDALATRGYLIPHAKGYPGRWQIGFLWYGEREEVRLCPAISTLDLDHGWSALLRWLRARQYDPRKHYYDSTNVHGITITHARDVDDDD